MPAVLNANTVPPSRPGVRDTDFSDDVDVMPMPESAEIIYHSDKSTTGDDVHIASSGTTSSQVRPEVHEAIGRSSVVRFPARRFKVLQQWECEVRGVDSECVSCVLRDLTDESRPDEMAEVYVEEFSKYDRPRLREGAIFYWSIGHETSAAGQVRRISEFRMRRTLAIKAIVSKALDREAAKLSDLLQFHGDSAEPDRA